ncbi:hypothetical protein [Alienimonas chondri]|uniref:DUF3251 domain-containing protein n=1 Tax=Alienimonas chondri TaxID=2681879 RepID=A0ABX1VD36_9PLAN|nr:hypothetical protein [Alienimonas chondri]NNJ25807.1 hypothetical protein [Alienimonas chondri]
MRLPRPAAALAPLCLVGLAGGLIGCAADDASVLRGDLLRTQDELTRTESELREARAELAAAERSADRLRDQVVEDGGVVVASAEQVRAMGRVSQLTIAKLLTGGLDRDGLPGEEVLAVVLTPADDDGDPVKTAGAVSFELLDLGADPDDRRIEAWSFDDAECAVAWRRSPIGIGYRFRLPLPPRNPGETGPETLHLVARFAANDGRRFDVTHPLELNRPPAPGTPAAFASAATDSPSSDFTGAPAGSDGAPADRFGDGPTPFPREDSAAEIGAFPPAGADPFAEF